MAQPAGPTGRFALQVAHKTDPGLDPDKQINEDSFMYAEVPAGHLLVVCDGMGGHASGREASQKAIETILREMQAAVPAPGPALKRAIEIAGRAVYEIGGPPQHRLRPGSTCVALLVHAGGIEVAHVGDSRGYMTRGGAIYPITRDHSMVQQMIDAGVLTPEDAIGHPDANKITRALGMTPDVEVELRPSPIPHEKGDLLLLASDGLCDLVTQDEINAVLLQAMQTRGVSFACDQLVALANARGGHDNITVVIAQVTEQTEYRRTIPETVAAAAMPALPVAAPAAMPPVTAPLPTVVARGSAPTATLPELPTIPEPGAGPAPTVIDTGPDELSMSSGDWQQPEAKRSPVLLVAGIGLMVLGLVIAAAFFAWAVRSGSQSESEETNAPPASAVTPTGGGAPRSSGR
jgi:PPM family protein phosphatase